MMWLSVKLIRLIIIIVIMIWVSDFLLLFWNLFYMNLLRLGFCVSILVVISII